MRLTPRRAGTAILAAGLVTLGMVVLLTTSTGAAPAEGKDYGPQLREISKKLDELVASHAELKQQLETQHAAIMEEMRIIKVRTFQAGKPRS